MRYLAERRREVSKVPQTMRVPSCEVVIVAEKNLFVVDLLASPLALASASEHLPRAACLKAKKARRAGRSSLLHCTDWGRCLIPL